MPKKQNPKKQFELFKKRLEGTTIQQLSLDFKIARSEVEEIIAAVTQEIVDACTLSLKQKRALELERLDYWTNTLERALQNDCDDAVDPETGRVYRDGVKSKALIVSKLLDLSKHRTVLLKLVDIEEDVANEAAQLMRKLNTVNVNELETVEDLLDFNTKIHKQ